MAQSTRDELLETAMRLFAERGFDGVSIANIADEHGLTKQALLHHFKTKEKLYGEILLIISRDLNDTLSEALETYEDPQEQLNALLLGFVSSGPSDDIRTRLLMRELLDNQRRAATAGAWPLSRWLERLTEVVEAAIGSTAIPKAQTFALLYQLLGAVNYFAISQPTLNGILGASEFDDVQKVFGTQLKILIEAALSSAGDAQTL